MDDVLLSRQRRRSLPSRSRTTDPPRRHRNSALSRSARIFEERSRSQENVIHISTVVAFRYSRLLAASLVHLTHICEPSAASIDDDVGQARVCNADTSTKKLPDVPNMSIQDPHKFTLVFPSKVRRAVLRLVKYQCGDPTAEIMDGQRSSVALPNRDSCKIGSY